MVTTTDANGCTSVESVTISEPSAITATISSSNDPSCNGYNDGTLTVNANGGTPNYTYDLGTGVVSQANFISLGAGSYTVTVTDASGCSETTNTITLTDPVQLNSTASQTGTISCAGFSDGSATVSANGGTGAYSYLWSNGTTAVSANGLGAGVYNVTTTDANNCMSMSSVTLTDPAGMSSSATVTSNYNGSDLSCFGSTDGSAQVTVTGGTPGYSYSWSTGSTGNAINSVGSGIYTVTITDASACSTISTVNISEPNALNIIVLDNGNGSASAQTNGGTGAYTYLWDSNAANQTTSTATGLSDGSYTVTVTDANGCQDSTSITIVISSFENIDLLSEFNVFPNPNNGNFLVKAVLFKESDFTIRITNLLGQELLTKLYHSKAIMEEYTLNDVTDGVYYITITFENHTISKKLVVVK